MCHEKNGNPHVSLEYVTGSFVFRLQASANGYGSYVDVYTRRHFDNCLRNGSAPWAFLGIKVKADNGEFVAFDPEFTQFVEFCEMWINNPHETEKKVRAEIAESDKPTFPPDYQGEFAGEGNTKPEYVSKNLDDFPYTVKVEK